MDSLQLRYALLKHIKNKHVGVYASDQLKYITEKDFAVISNSSPSNEKGMHWIAFFVSRNVPNTIEMFDSYGMTPMFYNNDINQFIKRFKIVKRISVQFQSNTSMVCGNFSLFYLINRSRGCSFTKIVSCFDRKNLQENDSIVKKYVSGMNIPSMKMCRQSCARYCNENGLDFSSVCIQKNQKCFKIYQHGVKQCK